MKKYIHIASNIKTYRKRLGLTQKQLGEKVYKTEISIRKYESGAVNIPPLTLIEICNALNVSADQLLGEDKSNYSIENFNSEDEMCSFFDKQKSKNKSKNTWKKILDKLDEEVDIPSSNLNNEEHIIINTPCDFNNPSKYKIKYPTYPIDTLKKLIYENPTEIRLTNIYNNYKDTGVLTNKDINTINSYNNDDLAIKSLFGDNEIEYVNDVDDEAFNIFKKLLLSLGYTDDQVKKHLISLFAKMKAQIYLEIKFLEKDNQNIKDQ